MHRVMTGLNDCLLLGGVTSRGGLTHCLETRPFVICQPYIYTLLTLHIIYIYNMLYFIDTRISRTRIMSDIVSFTHSEPPQSDPCISQQPTRNGFIATENHFDYNVDAMNTRVS